MNLKTLGDLEDLARIDRAVLALEGPKGHGLTRLTLRRGVQEPLRMFSKWLAGNRRYLDRNPLLEWIPLDVSDVEHFQRRACLPEEVARALLAADLLDALNKRKHPTRIVFLALLIGGSRVGALIQRDVGHLLREQSRIDLGRDVGKKHRGECALDAKTLQEVIAYLCGRETGPRLLSPKGTRLDDRNLCHEWQEAFSLGVVDALWPKNEPRDFETEYLVSASLLRGRVCVHKGGNPQLLRPETVKARLDRAAEILRLVNLLRGTWEEKLRGVDVHAFRMTHETWARAKNVPPILIDKQLGHSTAAGAAALDAARSLILESPTGRKHYLDMGASLLDARRSAEAVRDLLDAASLSLKTGLLPTALVAREVPRGESAS